MELHSTTDQMLLVCLDIVKVDIRDWPKISEKNLDHPNIFITEVTFSSEGNTMFLLGRGVLESIHLDRNAHYTYFRNDFYWNKVIMFGNNRFIGAVSGNFLDIGTF